MNSYRALSGDFDNDGLKDYLVTNGYRRDISNNDFRAQLDSIGRNSKPGEIEQNLLGLYVFYKLTFIRVSLIPLRNHRNLLLSFS